MRVDLEIAIQEQQVRLNWRFVAMKLASVNVDDNGDSYFGEIETSNPPGTNKERELPIAYWQVWETHPGYFADFKTVDAPKALAMMTGKLEVTVSSGEKRYFSRGDTFLLQDVRGTGHAIRTVGRESTQVMLITMKNVIPEFA